MSVKLKPVSEIKANLGINPSGPVENYFAQRCAVHMDKYVPARDYHLRKYRIINNNQIYYNGPYAHYMYVGELYVDPETGSSWARKDATKVPTGKPLTYHTSGTGPYWDKKMWSSESESVIEEVQNFIRRR